MMDDSEYVTRAEFYWMLGEIRRVFEEGVNRLMGEIDACKAEIQRIERNWAGRDRAPMLTLGGPMEFIDVTDGRVPRAETSAN